MAQWYAAYCPILDWNDSTPETRREIPRYRVYSVDDPGVWIMETNPDLPPEVQEDAALMLAQYLSTFLGV